MRDPQGARRTTVRPTGRRKPEEAEAEILDVAQAFLRDHPVRELTIGKLMANASVGRSAFYAYFRDQFHLVTTLLDRYEADLQEASRPWLEGSSNPADDVRTALTQVVGVWAEHGPVLRAIADAATQDEEVEEAYRWGLLERFIDAIATRLAQEQKAGLVPVDLDARETAAALILMNERYLVDRMGQIPPADPERVVATLTGVWVNTLYPTHEEGDRPAR